MSLKKNCRIAILGGGITGLAVAWFLKQKQPNIELMLFEKNERLGGWIQTIQQDGFLFEQGPRGFRPSGKGETTMELIKKLGLEKEVIAAAPLAKKRFLYLDGKLRVLSLPLLLQHGALGALWRDLWCRTSKEEDESIQSFAYRRFNKEIAETLIDPLVTGIFGGDMDQLSYPACFPSLWSLEKTKGSIVKGMLMKRRKKQRGAALCSFKNGMNRFVMALGESLSSSLFLASPVKKIERSGKSFVITTPSRQYEVDAVVSALPDHTLSDLVQIAPAISNYVTLSTVNLGWNQSLLHSEGFGFLIPSKEKKEILGMTFDSAIFPEQEGKTRICVMIRGEHSEESLKKKAYQALAEMLQITTPPEICITKTALQAIPQYRVGHLQRLALQKSKLPSHFYALGSCYNGVGVNDCVEAAFTFAQHFSF